MIGSNRRYIRIMPGYTGHVPGGIDPREAWASLWHFEGGHIPGYAGYVSKVKPENMFGSSFGQLTNAARSADQLTMTQSLSVFQESFRHPAKVGERSKSNVRVKPLRYNYLKPNEAELAGLKTQLLKTAELAQPAADEKAEENEKTDLIDQFLRETNPMTNTTAVFRVRKSQPVAQSRRGNSLSGGLIENAIPGYAGHRRKIISENVFAKTFRHAQASSTSLMKEAADLKENTLNFHQSLLPFNPTRAQS